MEVDTAYSTNSNKILYFSTFLFGMRVLQGIIEQSVAQNCYG